MSIPCARLVERLRKNQTVKNTGWMMIGNLLGVFLQAGTFISLARLLGPNEYGVFIGAFALTNIFAQYSSLGSGTVMLRYVSVNRALFPAYWANVLLLTAATSFLLITALMLLGHHLVSAASASLLLPAGISNCFCFALTVEAGRVFQSFHRLRMTALLNTLISLLRFLSATGMILAFHHATAFQWSLAFTATSVAGTAIACTFVHRIGEKPALNLDVTRRHVFEGFGYSFAGSTTVVYNDLDKTMLSHYGMDIQNGVYTTAYRLLDIATMPIASLQAATIPDFFKLGGSGLAKPAALAKRLITRVGPGVLLMSCVIFVTAPLIPKVLGSSFSQSATALRWLCLIPAFRTVHLLMGCALTGAGLQRFRTASQIVACLLNFGLNLFLIPTHGWYGAAWASLLTDGSLAVLNTAIVFLIVSRESHEAAYSIAEMS